MNSPPPHMQGWPRAVLLMALITTGIFLARMWVFPPPMADATAKIGAVAQTYDLKVHYHNRPPYYAKTPKGVEGLCATPVDRAMKAAGIAFQWTQTPPKRQLHLLSRNPSQDCIVGWYKTREREAFARYSTVIYQDKPAVALVRRGDARIPDRASLAELLSIPDIVMLSRPGYTYGGVVERALAKAKPTRITSGADSSELISILYSRRADFIFIAPEEANYLLERTQLPRDDFRFLQLTDMPPGNKRFVLFSQAVPAEIVDRFNAAFNAQSGAPGGRL